jgi:hypothetical protein
MAGLWSSTRAKASENDPVAFLQQTIVDEPSLPSDEILAAMARAAASKRLDAAIVLIRCLVYNLDPGASDDKMSEADMIPAIGMLKKHFGSQVLPLISFEGITSTHDWMRERCALAIRSIGSKDEVAKLSRVFSFDTSPDANVQKFASLVKAQTFKVQMFDPRLKELERLDRALENIKRNR